MVIPIILESLCTVILKIIFKILVTPSRNNNSRISDLQFYYLGLITV